jgi:hypothetical protein
VKHTSPSTRIISGVRVSATIDHPCRALGKAVNWAAAASRGDSSLFDGKV